MSTETMLMTDISPIAKSNPPGVSVEVRKKRGEGRKTLLNDNQVRDILTKHFNHVGDYRICKDFKISYSRLYKIINNGQKFIDELRLQDTLKLEKEFVPKVISKRHEILDSISKKDIKGSKLAAKASAISDLTHVKRLENNQSTENISVLTKLSKDDLIKYIMTGELQSVNKDEKNEYNAVIDEKDVKDTL